MVFVAVNSQTSICFDIILNTCFFPPYTAIMGDSVRAMWRLTTVSFWNGIGFKYFLGNKRIVAVYFFSTYINTGTAGMLRQF